MICLECNKKLRSINNQHLASCCGLNRFQYMEKHNVSQLVDDDYIAETRRVGSSNGQWKGGNTNRCAKCQAPIYKYKNVTHCSACSYERKKQQNAKRATQHCPVCKELFMPATKSGKYYRKTCSQICAAKLISEKSRNNPNCGARAHYIRSQRQVYKGCKMDSTWEVILAQWMDLENIKWIRSRNIFFYWTDDDGLRRKYFPDFYLPDLDIYVDTKNTYLVKKDRKKILRVKKENHIQIYAGGLTYIKRVIRNQQILKSG